MSEPSAQHDQPVKLLVVPERTATRNDEVTELDVVLEVRCRIAEEATGRTGGAMNLCLVIDRSGSMSGQKLETAKRSCVEIFRRITGNSLLTVVVFDDEAEVVINPQTPRDKVEEKLGAIRTGGMTNLSLGWYQGLLELQTHMTDQHYNRLVLLSDGMANRGETKKATLASMASRARDVGITTSTVGIGTDFQEDLLEAVSTASGGRFWYIGDSAIESILEEEFLGALTVAYDRPRVRLDLPAGVKISEELHSLRSSPRGGYGLRSLKGQDVFNFAVRLEVDPERVDGESFRIGATLYNDREEVTAAEETVTLAPRPQVAATPVHPLVTSVVAQHRAASTDEKLMAGLESGDLSSMRTELMAEVERMRAVEADIRKRRSMWGDEARYQGEMGNVGVYMGNNAVSLALTELLAPYGQSPVVQHFLSRWRKVVKRGWARNDYRDIGAYDVDSDNQAGLLLEAIRLVDRLILEFPQDRAALEEHRERIRDQLAQL
ncbi:VWA domain-containing protein [Streptomyces sp. NPDC005526]|uniref:vWA domain-containing protein n=1 Tax=Streptomyces sp. NPDC005526 TaxID=3156885 RepID=UPI0033BA4EFD